MRQRLLVPTLISIVVGTVVAVIVWALLIGAEYPLQYVLLTAGLAVLSASMVSTWLNFRQMKKEVRSFDQDLEQILNTSSDAITEDSIENTMLKPVKLNVLEFIQEFKSTALTVVNTGDKVAIGSAEISYFLDKLKETINGNVGHANQISVAAEEISQTTSVISETATSVSRVVGEARTYSDDGINAIEKINHELHQFKDNVVASTSDARSLSELSEKIQNITQVINGVADQTNLLALNAAIEAARAGEHGRGFAVVADEVRTLATQTTNATKEIGEMLDEVKNQTERSVKTMSSLEGGVSSVVDISEDAKQTFNNIQNSTQETEAKIYEINNILSEHVTASREISSSVLDMSREMEDSGNRAVEVSNEAFSLAKIGEQLNALLSIYELGTEHELYRNVAIDTANRIGAMFEKSIESGEIAEADLFDRDYQPIPDTSPEKHSTRFDAYTDKVLPAIQEPILEQHSDILYAGAVDDNGYFPTHNKRYSQALTGDYDTDLANNRTKRIFTDRTGSRCGSNKDPFLLQTYKRDTGEVMHDVSAPITVNGKHWGGFRMGYKSNVDNDVLF